MFFAHNSKSSWRKCSIRPFIRYFFQPYPIRPVRQALVRSSLHTRNHAQARANRRKDGDERLNHYFPNISLFHFMIDLWFLIYDFLSCHFERSEKSDNVRFDTCCAYVYRYFASLSMTETAWTWKHFFDADDADDADFFLCFFLSFCHSERSLRSRRI